MPDRKNVCMDTVQRWHANKRMFRHIYFNKICYVSVIGVAHNKYKPVTYVAPAVVMNICFTGKRCLYRHATEN